MENINKLKVNFDFNAEVYNIYSLIHTLFRDGTSFSASLNLTEILRLYIDAINNSRQNTIIHNRNFDLFFDRKQKENGISKDYKFKKYEDIEDKLGIVVKRDN